MSEVGHRLSSLFFHGLSRAGRLHPRSDPRRHRVEVTRDLRYLPGAVAEHVLDVYRPTGRPGPLPVVFYVHGGAFRILSKDTHWLMGLAFARHGYLVVNISYRLAPTHPYPAAIDDTCRAWLWTLDAVERLGGDLGRVAVAGESAGGNLVTALTLAACQRRDEPYARAVFDAGVVPRATLPFCALLEVSRPERFARRPMPGYVHGMLRGTSAAYLRGAPPAVSRDLADPLVVLERGGPLDRPLPPFFAPVGTRDPLLDDTRRLERALAGLGVPCEARYYPGGIHAFHALVWQPLARHCWRDALAFLDRHTRPAGARGTTRAAS
ncbi:MAG: alpha/beta hydrolase [Kofleriaceae bacterium]|nr:alpha/beta hydrolase [Kofleriaceae bacterium]MCL4227808.1 alpha/beta hydrolase [Myxococcales bacterium]